MLILTLLAIVAGAAALAGLVRLEQWAALRRALSEVRADTRFLERRPARFYDGNAELEVRAGSIAIAGAASLTWQVRTHVVIGGGAASRRKLVIYRVELARGVDVEEWARDGGERSRVRAAVDALFARHAAYAVQLHDGLLVVDLPRDVPLPAAAVAAVADLVRALVDVPALAPPGTQVAASASGAPIVVRGS